MQAEYWCESELAYQECSWNSTQPWVFYTASLLAVIYCHLKTFLFSMHNFATKMLPANYGQGMHGQRNFCPYLQQLCIHTSQLSQFSIPVGKPILKLSCHMDEKIKCYMGSACMQTDCQYAQVLIMGRKFSNCFVKPCFWNLYIVPVQQETEATLYWALHWKLSIIV